MSIWSAPILIALLFLGSGQPAPADDHGPRPAGRWHPPVDAPIVDYFRPPSNPYGPGNRGLEYGTVRGQPVRAVDKGVVAFAGSVGRHRFVVVSHGLQLRSTYAYLGSIVVEVGDHVVWGQEIASAEPGFHLTARVNGQYVDPLPFFGLEVGVRLVPVVREAPLVGRSNRGRTLVQLR